ncbi:hypothetical protein ACX31A_09625 [Dermacoccus nishinomiyaensis]
MMKTAEPKVDENSGAAAQKGGDALGAVVGMLWDFVTGRPMGQIKTDATFWHDGTRVAEDNRGRMRASNKVPAHAFLAHRTRFVARLLGCTFLMFWALWPSWMEPIVQVVAGVLIGLAAGIGLRRFRTRRWTRTVIDPLKLSVKTVTGSEPASLTVPTNFRAPGARTHIVMPADFVRTDAMSASLKSALSDRLGIPASDMSMRWGFTQDAAAVLVLSRRALIPTKASPRMPEVQEAMTRCKPGAVVLGLARGGRPVVADLDSDSPHLMMGAGSGGGKSVLVSGVCAQLMRQGAAVEILDTKVSSHPWANDLAGRLPYLTATPEIHDALVRLGDEMQRRNDALLGLGAAAQAETVAGYQRMAVVIEEVNTLTPRLKTYWEGMRERTDPKLSPAIAALVEIANMGRAVKCHLVFCGQRLSVDGLGGSREAGAQIRASAGVRIVARYDKALWGMVMDGTYRPAPGIAGRAVTQISGTRRETQTIYWADDDAAVWATGGTTGGDVLDAEREWSEVEATQADETQELVPVIESMQIEARRPAEPVTDPDAQKFIEDVETFVRKSDAVSLDKGEGTPGRGSHMPQDSGDSEPGDTSQEDASTFVRMSMREWCASREFGTTTARGVDVLKSAKKRDPRFPQSVGTDGVTKAALYDVAALDAWAESRKAGTRLGESS